MQWKGIGKMPDYRLKHGNLRYPTHFPIKFILGYFLQVAVHGPVRPFHGLIRSFHGPVRSFHGLSMDFFQKYVPKRLEESAILFNHFNF